MSNVKKIFLLRAREVDVLFRYPAGRTKRLAMTGRLPFISLPDGEIRFDEALIQKMLESSKLPQDESLEQVDRRREKKCAELLRQAEETNISKSSTADRKTYIELLLVNDSTAAEMLHINLSQFRKLNEKEEIPQSIKVGRFVRWVVKELKDWGEAGCPPRSEWIKIKAEGIIKNG